MIKICMIGNLGANAESRNANGVDYTTFRIASNRRWTDKDGVIHDDTTWINCIGKNLGNVRPFLQAGKKVYVEGTPSVRVYQSNKDRNYYAAIDVNVLSLELLSPKQDAPAGSISYTAAPQSDTPLPQHNEQESIAQTNDAPF